MASNERGRSPSASRLNNNNTSSSTAPQLQSFDPSSFATSDSSSAPAHFTSAGAYQDPTLFADSSYTFAGQQGNKLPLASGLASQGDQLAFYQSQGFTAAQGNNLSDLDYNVSPTALNRPGTAQDSSAFPSFDFNQADFSDENALDPSLLAELDSQQGLGASLDPMATASMQAHSPTPPHLMPDMARRQSGSPSPHASPVFQQPSYTRPRNVSDSLDPSSAMYPHNQTEWSNMSGYRTHQRTPSDQYSDYSSHSNQASPYLQTYDSFDANAHSSPLLNPQQDPVFNDGLGLGQFTLNENQTQATYPTPGHSPQPSPRLPPQQQALPMYTADNNFGLSSDGFQQSNALDMFPGPGQEPFPQHNNKPQSPSDFSGAADQMSPPDIHVDYAPPATNPNQIVRSNNDGEALSPPARTQSRNRMRAKSDPYAGSRSPSPALSGGRGRSPSLQPQMSNSDTLSPFDAASSRSPSPRGRVEKASANRARSTSHTSDHRDYILNLAEPDRAPPNGLKDSGRVQKHPATFQCHLCPKRFTRAYNLRSHLRTHTDERPFVCTVCGKAFARQHDRKRHEGLHSGEKKFVCKGNLQSGVQWGCGRRFARADALGRHFRSEAGRVCIKPLLEEEAEERHKNWLADQQAQQQSQMSTSGLVQPAPLLSQSQQIDMNSNFLPAVLLQQYPALAGIDWNSIPQDAPQDEDVYSGRSSFEASSGGEYYEDLSENEMGNVGFPDAHMGGMMQGMSGMQAPGGAVQSQQGFMAYGGQTRSDYLSDFEGR